MNSGLLKITPAKDSHHECAEQKPLFMKWFFIF